MSLYLVKVRRDDITLLRDVLKQPLRGGKNGALKFLK